MAGGTRRCMPTRRSTTRFGARNYPAQNSHGACSARTSPLKDCWNATYTLVIASVRVRPNSSSRNLECLVSSSAFVLASRIWSSASSAVDKCRAVLVGWQGEYHSNCPLDQRWLKFAEINYDAFRLFVATGATDDEIVAWIGEHAKKRSRADIVIWNNRERDLRLSDLTPELQEYMEDYIQKYVPRNRGVYRWFDVYDLEEERL